MKVGLLVEITENCEQQLRHAKKLGFDTVQISNWNMDFYTDENLTYLKALISALGLTVTDFWCGWSGPVDWKYPNNHKVLGLVPEKYRAQRLNDLKKGALFAYNLGIKSVISHTGFIPDNPEAEGHIGVVNALKELCGELKERGQTFSFETGEELPVTLGIVINKIGLDNVGINLDPANLISDGRANPIDALELFGEKVFCVHAKDAIPPKFGEAGGKQVPIGEGKVDFEKLIRILKANGFDKNLIIEHEMYDRENRDQDIKNARIYLETLINKVYNY